MSTLKYFQFSLLVCFLVFNSCDNSTESKDPEEIKIADNTVVINDEVDSEPTQINDDSIEFEFDQTAPDISVGDIIAGYNDSTAYLRKVTDISTSQGTMTVETNDATLDEVIEQGGFEWSGPLEFDLEGSLQRGEVGYIHPAINITGLDRNSNSNSGINFSFNGAGINFGTDMDLEIQSGSFSFTPYFDIDADYDWGLQEAHAIVSGDLDFDILAELTLSATEGVSGEIPLITDVPAGTPITIFAAGWPIVIYPEFDLFLGVSVTSTGTVSLTGGINSDNTIEAGFQWTDDNGFESIYEKSFDGNIHPVEISTTTNQTIKVYLKPRLSFMIYSAAGPHIALEPYIGESGTNYTDEYCTEWLLGITGEVGANIDILGYSVSAGIDLPDWNTTIDEECEETGECVDYDGNSYETVQIGDQLWMAENLKVTHYNNGDEIPNITNMGDWASLSTGAYCDYDNNPTNSDTYGRLYNWYAVDDARGICPEGWHVPTDEEYQQLEIYLGMDPAEADDTGWRGTDEGGKMKETGTEHWNSPNTGATNESGFTGLPAGYRNANNGSYSHMGYNGYFWSSSEHNSTNAWYRLLYYHDSYVYRYDTNKHFGFSVRCAGD